MDVVGDHLSFQPDGDLLSDAQFAVPDDVPRLVSKHARRAGARDAAIFLVDYEQRVLTPLPRPGGPERESVTVEGTLAGRAFSSLSPQWSGDGTLLWMPMVEGNERLGVIGFELEGPTDDTFLAAVAALTTQAAELIVAKANYGDFFEYYRRRQSMSIASELAWQLLPPLTFGSERVVISGALAPAYDLGGDTFDYGVDAECARIAVFDAMGHGLEAGLLATVAVAAYRNSRRRRLKLAFDSAFARPPTREESQKALEYLSLVRQRLEAAGVTSGQLTREAWASFLRAMLATNEFVYVD